MKAAFTLVFFSSLLISTTAFAVETEAQIRSRCSDLVHQQTKDTIEKKYHTQEYKERSIKAIVHAEPKFKQAAYSDQLSIKFHNAKYDEIDSVIRPLEQQCFEQELAKRNSQQISAEDLSLSAAAAPASEDLGLRAPASNPAPAAQ